MRKLVPVRLLRNPFYEKVREAEESGAEREELAELLGRGRAKKGMYEGDLTEGELEIGQVSAMLDDIPPAAKILQGMWSEFQKALKDPLGRPPDARPPSP
jgi:enoyl-[acyl-carrier protein] reductase II